MYSSVFFLLYTYLSRSLSISLPDSRFSCLIPVLLAKMVPENMKDPYKFELFHASQRKPTDLYQWGNDFFRPLVVLEDSM